MSCRLKNRHFCMQVQYTIHCRYNSYDYNGHFSIVHYYPLFQHTTQYYTMHQNHIIISTFLHIIQFQHHQLTKAMHLIIVLSKFGEKKSTILAQNGGKILILAIFLSSLFTHIKRWQHIILVLLMICSLI